MIISRAPARVSIAGGGTDLPSYYEKHGGYFLSAAIDKHIVVTANSQFYDTYRIKGYTTEEHEDINGIQHNLYREALNMYNVSPGIELVSISDIPSQAGLGSSGAFLSSLLNTLELLTQGSTARREIAEKACRIEIDLLDEHVGKQDQYASTYGGITEYKVSKNGKVEVRPLQLSDFVVDDLRTNLYLFYTDRQRQASEILKEQDERTQQKDSDVVDTLTWYKEQAVKLKDKLESGDADAFGYLMKRYWERKKKYSDKVTTPFINKCHTVALENGVLGGKCMGAGGGGFLLFYHNGPPKSRWKFLDEMQKLGLRRVPFQFDFEGVTTLYNGEYQ